MDLKSVNLLAVTYTPKQQVIQGSQSFVRPLCCVMSWTSILSESSGNFSTVGKVLPVHAGERGILWRDQMIKLSSEAQSEVGAQPAVGSV